MKYKIKYYGKARFLVSRVGETEVLATSLTALIEAVKIFKELPWKHKY